MNYEVPQYIDVEDKIAFQLTAKQLGWFGLGGFAMFIAWHYATQEFFLMWSVIIVLAVLAMAFLKPHGITMAAFFTYGFLFFLKPKRFIWQREVDLVLEEEQEIVEKQVQMKKTLTNTDKLAEVLDSNKIRM